jgi:glycosyltransferase involved in cell wall biosynthesis
MRCFRIAIFLPSLKGGGAERVMVTLANGFAQRGYVTDLVLATATGPYLTDVAENVRILDLHARRVSHALMPLMRYLKQERPVAMLSAMNHANVIAVLARSWSGVSTRLVVSERNTISIEAQRARKIIERVVYALVPWAYKKASAIVAISQDAARDLEKFARLSANSVNAIYNPCDVAFIQQRATEAVSHPWFLCDKEQPIIIAIGRLTEQKDYSTLLHAFAQVRLRIHARLLILGEGEQRNHLEALAQSLGLGTDELSMPGFVKNPFAYLAHADLFVLSSRWEGLANVLIEAMACGTPVVSTDCPSGPREILEGGRWGSLVPVGDIDALAHAIKTVLSTPRSSLPNVRKRAEDFSPDRALDAYLRVLSLPAWANEGNN